MNNRRSYLDSMNAGRRRRSSTSLEQLSQTLDDLENRIRRPFEDRDEPRQRRATQDSFVADRERRAYGRDRRADSIERDIERGRSGQESRAALDALSAELGDLRAELRHQMGTGLRREFSSLKSDIDRALAGTAPGNPAAELGAEFERLTGMIGSLANRGDDRQIDLLRHEMEEVKGILGKLAREDTLQSYDRRWEQLDQRWSEIADLTSQSQSHQARIDPALQHLTSRIEQIGDAINVLPTSVSLRALEDKMKVLASAVDQFAHQQDRIGPEALDAIEQRLDEISRAVAASATPVRPSSIDQEPFERIEARIASLAKLVGDATSTNPVDGLAEQLSTIAMRVDDLARRVDVPDQTIDRLADQIARIAGHLDSAPADRELSATLAGLDTRFADLSRMLEQRHEDALAQGQTLFRDLERRLNDVALTMNSSDFDGAPPAMLIDAMDARFAELADRLDRKPTGSTDDKAVRDLEQRILSLSDRIEQSTQVAAVDPDLIRSLEAQVGALAAQLAAPRPPAGGSDLGPRLDKIESAIAAARSDVVETARVAAEEAVRHFSGSAADRDVVAGLVDDLKSLETLARKSDDRNSKTFEAIHDTLLKIVGRLGTIETSAPARHAMDPSVATVRQGVVNVPSAPSIEPAMDSAPLDVATDTEQPVPPARHVSQATSPRRSAAAAAAEAAADAVRKDMNAADVPEATPGRRSLLSGLARVLPGRKPKAESSAVPEVSTASDERKEPVLAGDPPLDPVLANKPLEPGSGTPDLNAIMKRVRDERGQPVRGQEADAAKSDFIAAARRAAQAAAAEAEMMKRNPVAKVKSGGLGLGGMLKNRRKPVLMGIAAILIALTALQAGRSFLTSGDDIARVESPAPVVAEAPIEVIEPEPSDVADAEPAVPAARMAEASQPPALSARSAMTAAPPAPEAVSTDWLETATTLDPEPGEATVSDPAGSAAAPIEETLPETDQDALAAIPVDAGPIALREAAATGDPKAYFEIGNRYAEGRGVSEDMTEAAGWYEKAADAGLAPAQYRIGNLYEKGVGVERDVAKAKTWYQLAAAQGNASAMHNLAVLFAMGADGTSDNESAARWFLEAAELGVKDSQFNLGILSAKGVGMPQNLEEAYKWFALVAKTGDKDASDKRDEIANALRPEQLEKARAAAELWRARDVEAEANTVDVPDSWNESQDTTAGIDLKQAVQDIQAILNKNGYDAGPADGLMGRRTQSAIAAFQTDNGMAATGEVDEPLVRALLAKR
jgi:localization factor PodJL